MRAPRFLGLPWNDRRIWAALPRRTPLSACLLAGVQGGGELEGCGVGALSMVEEHVDRAGECGFGVAFGGGEVGGAEGGGAGVGHGDAEGGPREHGGVVVAVAEGEDFVGLDVHGFCDGG